MEFLIFLAATVSRSSICQPPLDSGDSGFSVSCIL